MVLIILLILLIFFFEGYFLYTKKRWKELTTVSIILALSLYLTLAENQILPNIDIAGALDVLFKPVTEFIGTYI